MASNFFDQTILVALVGAFLGLLMKVVYDRWLSRTSRVTMDLFDSNNKLIDQRFERMLETCKGKQVRCSGNIIAKMELSSALLEKQIEGHSIRLGGGDECFDDLKDGDVIIRKTLKVILLTLFELCQSNCCEKTMNKLRDEIETI